MKKLIVALLAIAMICSFALPVLADETASPVKDYETAENGDLLYKFDFSGKDGVVEYGNLGETSADKYFTYTPSEDGYSLSIAGIKDSGKEKGLFWGGVIPSLEANFNTTYTLTYKVKMHGDVGLNNSIGVGSYFISGQTDVSMSNYNLYGNYTTKDANGNISMRRSSISINNQKQNGYTQWDTLDAYEIDDDGFVTAMLVYDGPTMTMTAYLRADGAGDGSKESDWVLVEEMFYVPSSDCMGILFYTYYIQDVNVTVKDVCIYKGLLYTPEEPVAPPTEAPTTKPTTKPTEKPAASEPAAAAPSEFPWGVVIGIAAAVVVATVVVILVLKKKKA